jgi:rhomboid protease GluP
MRKRTGSVVCPRCERLVGVSESKCPHCGAWQPGMFGYGPAIQRALGGQQFDLTNGITMLCAALYVLSLLLDPRAIFQMRGIFDFLSPSGVALFRLGMTGGLAWAAGQWWTVCTATFLHGSILHILFNMAIMRQYLPNLVHLYGTPRSFVIYMAGGAGGFLVSNVVTGHPTIGASGAIFGLLGALIAYGRRTHQTFVTQQLWMSALMMFVFGFLMSGVNNWAHAGGFAAGFLAAELMPNGHKREGMGLLALAGALAVVTLAGFVLSFLGFSPLGMMLR